MSVSALEITPAKYQYFTVDLLTNEIVGDIPFTNVSYQRVIRKAGTFSGSINATEETQDLDLYSTTMPGLRALYVLRNGRCTWGGIIWSREYDLNDKKLVVNASEFTSYLYHRVIWRTLTYANTWDQLDVAKNLLLNMSNDFEDITYTGAPAGATIGPFPDSADIGLLLSENDPTRTQDTQTWRGFELRYVGEVLETFSDNIDGFEYRIDCLFDGTTFTREVVIGSPRLGSGYEYGTQNIIFEHPGNVASIKLKESAENAATRYWVVGGGGEDTEYRPYEAWTTTSYLNSGWPLLDTTETSKHANASLPETLKEYARRYSFASVPPIAELEVTVNGSLDPQVGDYAPGDWCSIITNDYFISQRSRTVYEINDSAIVRRISSFKVTVPDTPTFPEIVDLELVTEWESSDLDFVPDEEQPIEELTWAWQRLSEHTDYASSNLNPVIPLEPYDNASTAVVVASMLDGKTAGVFGFYKWDIEAEGRPYTENIRVALMGDDYFIQGLVDVEIPGGVALKDYIEGFGEPTDTGSVWDFVDSEITVAAAGDYLYINADVYATNDPVIPDYTEGRWWTLFDMSSGFPVLIDTDIIYYTSGAPANWAPGNRSSVVGLDSTHVLEVSSQGLTVITVGSGGVTRGTPVHDDDMEILDRPRAGYSDGIGLAAWVFDGDYAYWPFTYATGTVTLGTRANGPFVDGGTTYYSGEAQTPPFHASSVTAGVFYDLKFPDPVGERDSVVVKLVTDGDTVSLGDVSGWVESSSSEQIRASYLGGTTGSVRENSDGTVDVLYVPYNPVEVLMVARDVFGTTVWQSLTPEPSELYPSPENVTAAWTGDNIIGAVYDWDDNGVYSRSAFFVTPGEPVWPT